MSHEDDGNANTRRRLRIPAALAVAVLGTSTSIAVTVSGCTEPLPPEPIDAGLVQSARDAGVSDTGDAMADAATVPQDAGVDAYMPPPDAPHT